MAERQRLAQSQLEHLLRPRREGDLPARDLFAGADDPHDLGADALDGDVEALEDAGRQALLLAEQAEQDVLGPDVVVLERSRLLLGEDDDLAGALCESLEHGAVESFFYGVAENPTAHFLFSAERMIGLSGRGRAAGMGQSSNRPRVTQAG